VVRRRRPMRLQLRAGLPEKACPVAAVSCA
jgi:hypothetical protein